MLGARCVLALFPAFVIASGLNECDTVTVGSTQGNSIQLPDISLARNIRVFGLDLLASGISPCPPGSVLVGSTISACDWIHAPVVSMDLPTYAIVTRTNKVDMPATAHAAVYCRPAASFPQAGPGVDMMHPNWKLKQTKPNHARDHFNRAPDLKSAYNDV